MKKILLINGPNLNLMGLREPEIYGDKSYQYLIERVDQLAFDLGIKVDSYQSNHEGDLVDKIQEAYGVYQGIVINPAAYTHTSVALLDALKAVQIPTVEVHISDLSKREDFRLRSYVGKYAEKRIIGKGLKGYEEAIRYLYEKYCK